MSHALNTKTAMILAAGLGTRLRPLTDTMPKSLVPYNGVPMIESLILRLKASGFSRLVINVHHFADMLEDFVRSRDCFGLDIAFSNERDLLRDTGGGIRHAWRSGLLGDSPVLIHNVDIITSGIDLNGFFTHAVTDRTSSSPADGSPAATLLVSDRTSSRYLLTGSDGLLRGWIYPAKGLLKGTGPAASAPTVHPAPLDPQSIPGLTPSAFSGIHIITPEAMRLMADWPEKFSIIDFYLHIAAVHPVRCTDASAEAVITDIGKLSQLN